MTNQEAIIIIGNLEDKDILFNPCDVQDAKTMAIKALEQEPKYCDRNICIKNEYNGIGCDECEVTKSQEPSGDLISRQAVLNTLDRMDNVLDTDRTVESYKELLTECYKVLPSIKQEPKTGHWIPTYGNVKCSVCGSVKDSRNVGKATHYCDFCGAKMESEDKE